MPSARAAGGRFPLPGRAARPPQARPTPHSSRPICSRAAIIRPGAVRSRAATTSAKSTTRAKRATFVAEPRPFLRARKGLGMVVDRAPKALATAGRLSSRRRVGGDTAQTVTGSPSSPGAATCRRWLWYGAPGDESRRRCSAGQWNWTPCALSSGRRLGVGAGPCSSRVRLGSARPGATEGAGVRGRGGVPVLGACDEVEQVGRFVRCRSLGAGRSWPPLAGRGRRGVAGWRWSARPAGRGGRVDGRGGRQWSWMSSKDLSATAPVVLAVEDLQWADPLTLRVLHAVVRRLHRIRLVLLATVRPGSHGVEVDRTVVDVLTRAHCTCCWARWMPGRPPSWPARWRVCRPVPDCWSRWGEPAGTRCS